jgi:RHS repeat-associated protein
MKASTRFLARWPSYLFALASAFGTTTSALAGETITYFHNDVAGTPIMATDTNGMQAWKETYQPYGDRLVESTASRSNALWFIGQPQDDNTGLSYLGARYYDPVLGRFMGVDPLSGNTANVHSWNRYAYANNNPYRFTDPTGLQASPDDDRRRNDVSMSGGSGWDGMDKKSHRGGFWGGWPDDGVDRGFTGMAGLRSPLMCIRAGDCGPQPYVTTTQGTVGLTSLGLFVGGGMLVPAFLSAPTVAAPTIGAAVEATAPRTVAEAIARGTLNPNSQTLRPLLTEIERQFAATQPKTAAEAMRILDNATRAAGLDLGFLSSVAADGTFTLINAGITTVVSPGGQVTFFRGLQIVLQLL